MPSKNILIINYIVILPIIIDYSVSRQFFQPDESDRLLLKDEEERQIVVDVLLFLLSISYKMTTYSNGTWKFKYPNCPCCNEIRRKQGFDVVVDETYEDCPNCKYRKDMIIYLASDEYKEWLAIQPPAPTLPIEEENTTGTTTEETTTGTTTEETTTETPTGNEEEQAEE